MSHNFITLPQALDPWPVVHSSLGTDHNQRESVWIEPHAVMSYNVTELAVVTLTVARDIVRFTCGCRIVVLPRRPQ